MKNSTKLTKTELDALNKYATWGVFWKIEIAVLVISITLGCILHANHISMGVHIFAYGVLFAILYPIIMVVMVSSTNKNHNAFLKSSTVNHYEFTEDYFIENTEQDGEMVSMTKLPYNKFIKCVDYKNYIFLFITKAQAYIIDKDTMTSGTVEGLVDFIEKKGIKIKKCK